MRFRSQHIADSVTQRIAAIAKSIRTGADIPIPQGRGAATVHLERSDSGDLTVTKTFEHGEPEIMTISSKAPVGFENITPNQNAPPGFTNITPNQETQPVEQQLAAGIEAPGIVENAATGGNAIDELLRT